MIKIAKALLSLRSEKDIENFLLDILTPQELKAMETRWEIAILLHEGKLSYLEIATKVSTSTTTVTRVNMALHKGNNGYIQALKNKK